MLHFLASSSFQKILQDSKVKRKKITQSGHSGGISNNIKVQPIVRESLLKISTIELLVLTSLGQLLFILKKIVFHLVLKNPLFQILVLWATISDWPIMLVSISRIFSCARPFYEQAVSDLNKSMHRSLWIQVTYSSFIEGLHTASSLFIVAHGSSVQNILLTEYHGTFHDTP